MREIKFRAWDKQNARWLEDWCYKSGEGIYYEFHEHGGCSIPQKEIFLMQYTGLKDKNGKEIYEGDIVSFNTCDPHPVYEDYLEDRACLTEDEAEALSTCEKTNTFVGIIFWDEYKFNLMGNFLFDETEKDKDGNPIEYTIPEVLSSDCLETLDIGSELIGDSESTSEYNFPYNTSMQNSLTGDLITYCKVIGNIYENPELIGRSIF